FGLARPADLEDHVRLAGIRSPADGGAVFGELVVIDARRETRAGFHDHVVAKGDDALDRLGRSRDTRLPTFDLARHEYCLSHRTLPPAGLCGRGPRLSQAPT